MRRDREIQLRTEDLRAAAHQSQDPTLPRLERRLAEATMDDHIARLAELGVIRRS